MNDFYQSKIEDINVDISIEQNEINNHQYEIERLQEFIERKEAYIEQLKQFKSDIENKLM